MAASVHGRVSVRVYDCVPGCAWCHIISVSDHVRVCFGVRVRVHVLVSVGVLVRVRARVSVRVAGA